MLPFNWHCPTKVFFGENKIQELTNILQQQKTKKVLFLYGHSSIKKNGLYDEVTKQLNASKIAFCELGGVDPNPRYETVLEGAKICKEQNVDFILAVGGGSVADCAKAISLASGYNGNNFWDEIIKAGAGHTIENNIPLGVILTLAATGTEMNSGGVISNLTKKEKLAIFSPKVIPTFAILDPTYTYSVPKHQIAAGIVDAFSHCLEQYFSSNDDSIISDGILISIMFGLKGIAQTAINNPNDYKSHANLMWGATMALNGISGVGKNTDWATHIIEHAVSAYYDITHAVGLAIIFPNWMEYVINEENAYRFQHLACLIEADTSGTPYETAKRIPQKLREFFCSLGMPSTFSEIDIKEEDLEGMVKSTFSKDGLTTIGAFKTLNKDDVRIILQKCF